MSKKIFWLGALVTLAACHRGGRAAVQLEEGTTYVNNTGGAEWVRLPDSSRVKISDSTVLVLAKGFGKDNREVDFDGEGMFDIRGGMLPPFVVHTGNLVIEVLGTRFRVDAVRRLPGEEVDLLEGRLRVTKSYHSDTDSVPETVDAGEMVMINREIDLMEKEKMNEEEVRKVKEMF